ncbi:MAG TPA: hypothetical protein VN151_04325 [Terracidiphilus sp.]|jgi:hypothetical protein|nr:hypothetical protein [Terracidiphilus sp.]
MQNVLTLEPSKLAFIERAEHELSAFHHAVAELYGSAEADRAAADWIEAFQSTPRSADAPLQWRRIAQSASSRLASRRAAQKPGPLGRIRQLMQKHHTPCFCSCGLK